MKTILVRRLHGQNEIVRTKDGAHEVQGVEKLGDFLKELKMDNHPQLMELAQVLKVDFDQFIQCAIAGYVDHSSRENIANYVFSIRLNGAQIDFLQSQTGNAGHHNIPADYNHLNYQPSV